MSVLSLCLAVYILSDDDNPSFKIAWLLPMLLFPVFGWAVYIIFGRRHLTKKIIGRFKDIEKSYTQLIENDETAVFDDENIRRIFSYITNTTGMPSYSNTETVYFPSGTKFFETYKIELKKAKKFIFIEYFIIAKGKFFGEIVEILKDKVAENVKVRIMCDDLGTINTLKRSYINELKSYGFELSIFNPFRPALDTFLNYRDHRKITVIDGVTAFTGGLNLADEYINRKKRFGYWKDCAIMIKGQVVQSMTLLFLKLWDFSTGRFTENALEYINQIPKNAPVSNCVVNCYDDGPMDKELVSEFTYMSVINNAKKYAYIITPYLILDNEMLTTLKLAAKSGVDVRIITPGVPDKKTINSVTKANYLPLISAGVRIYEFLPGFIHSKILVSDDTTAVIGTANFDFRSFYLHFENCLLMWKTSAIPDILLDFHETLEKCKEITFDYCLSTPVYKRMFRSVLKLFSPFM
jgi:cardiolipin synthase